MKHSPRRINQLARATGAQTYLEIGVFKGLTFGDVEIADRTGVDPQYRVSIEDLAGPGRTLVTDTSDGFFAGLDRSTVFDIVFLDGLHTFEQTYRDLCNALLHTHERSLIIIDDTRPITVYSAEPDIGRGKQLRRLDDAPGSGAYHGDVFKTVFAIHDFHPGLDYVTFKGEDNPQTLVWRSPSGREPRLDSFERISRLTYFDLLENLDVLKEMPEQDAIKRCLAAVNR